MDVCLDGRMREWMKRWIMRWVNAWMAGWTAAWMKEDDATGGQMNENS